MFRQIQLGVLVFALTAVAGAAIDRGGNKFGRNSEPDGVRVNEVLFDLTNAVIVVDGVPGYETDLRAGMILDVAGQFSPSGASGTADRVVFNDAVEGTIDALDTAGGMLSVLGQTVVVNADTAFAPAYSTASLDDLAAGDRVEVGGFHRADGSILATYIARVNERTGPLEVTGTVENLDLSKHTFTINALRISYRGAALGAFPGGVPAEGAWVEAIGRPGTGSELNAEQVEPRQRGISGEAGNLADVEGPITGFNSPLSFEVAGTPVVTTSNTEFRGGQPDDLAPGVMVGASGTLDASGRVVIAEVIEIIIVSVSSTAAD